jgi:esterase/lipase superfamily enzyme
MRWSLRKVVLALVLCAAASEANAASPGQEFSAKSSRSVRDAFRLPLFQTMRTSPYGNGQKQRYETVRVYYGTDRAIRDTKYPSSYYGTQRTPGGEIQFGYCDVAIPYDRKLGSLNASSLLRFLNTKSPEYWVTLLQLKQLEDERSFFELTKRELQRKQSKEIFVFVHGYNTSFEDAARRTGQLAYDLKWPGLAFFFSWPSRGEYQAYPADENTVEWAIPHLEHFLESTANRTNATAVNVIAHSMGNRLLVRALDSMATRLGNKGVFTNIVLAAPDIDRDVFLQLAAAIEARGKKVTIYASSTDKALALSRTFHGGVPRLGDALPRLFTFPGMDSIDVSAVDSGLDGHSYFGDSDSVLTDLYYLLRGQPADRRARLHRVLDIPGNAWIFQP